MERNKRMNLERNTVNDQPRGSRKPRERIAEASFADKWRAKFRRRRRRHDPMLVFNMSVFNFDNKRVR